MTHKLGFFNTTIEFYVTLALERAGVQVDGDVRSEIGAGLRDLQDVLDGLNERICRLETDSKRAATAANELSNDVYGY